MKVAKVHKSGAVINHIQAKRQPFFNKEGQGSFFSKSNEATQSFFSPTTVQPKLTIGQPNDKYEVEADAMADKVVQQLTTVNEPSQQNMGYHGNAAIQTKCNDCDEEEKLQKKEDVDVEQNNIELRLKPIFESNTEMAEEHVQTKPLTSPVIQPKCSTCEQEENLQKKEEELPENELELQKKVGTGESPLPPEDEENIQTKSGDGLAVPSDLQSRLNANNGGGNPLPPDTQSSMGSAFGVDFSTVRTHTGIHAVQMNKELNAQAFTHGNDIYFNQGKYDTNSNSGKHLLAHELTHTVQQSNEAKLKIQKFEAPIHEGAERFGLGRNHSGTPR